VKEMKKYFTAGRAKNDIAKTEKQDATILPIHVRGTVSPYPIVVTVICKQLPQSSDYNLHSRTLDWTTALKSQHWAQSALSTIST